MLLFRPRFATTPLEETDSICEIAFSTQPLDTPVYEDVSGYLHRFSITRGRSYEYDRNEAGTGTVELSNLDARFNPENTAGPYYPIKPTRRLRIRGMWDSVRTLFVGFTDGYPQQYRHGGFEARVTSNAIDWFLALRQFKFPTPTTFPEQLSGARINACLDMIGVASADRFVENGNSLIAASEDLGGQSILEHILLIADTENGRFYAAKDGKLTFKQRHSLLNVLDVVATFGDQPPELPYLNEVTVSHDDSKLANVIQFTLPDETVVEARDQDSIDEHFERTLQKPLPFATVNEAQDAADYLLSRLKEPTVRVGDVHVNPAVSPDALWPVVLDAEIGQRVTFRMRPKGGGDMIEQDSIVDGLVHSSQPSQWVTTFRLTPADTKIYWQLGLAGRSELEETTNLAY